MQNWELKKKKKKKKKEKKADPYFPIFWVGRKRANKHLFFKALYIYLPLTGGGHLYFRLVIILVKGLSKHTL